jgi:hypothetical protein
MVVHYFKEGRKRRIGHGIGLKTVSGAGDSLGLVADARLRWPYVAKGGEDSRGSTGGGERVGATRGGRRRAAGRCIRPGRGGGVKQRRNRAEIGIGEDEGDLVVKSRKFRGLIVKHGQLSHQCSNGDGPKSKNAGFFKLHNFALGFICRRAIVLKLI